MSHLAAWVLLGLLAGAVARMVLPGEERGGWFSTLVLGIIGAVVGGWIGRQFGYLPPLDPGEWMPSLRSVVSATVGAIVTLAVFKWLRP